MVNKLSSSNLYSHPGRLLESHLINTANLAEKLMEDKSINISKSLDLIYLVKLIALSHDIGKSTSFFQKYILASNEKKRDLKIPEARHSLLSAICGYFIIKKFFKSELESINIIPLLAFVSIKRHHGDLIDLKDEVVIGEKEINLLLKQIASINENNFDCLAHRLFNAGLPILLTTSLLKDWVERVTEELRLEKRAVRMIRKNKGDISSYFLLKLIYSVLLDADKNDVVVKRKDLLFQRKGQFFSEKLVDRYKNNYKHKEREINKLRELAYREIIGKEVSLDNRILSINLPTGMGKTITSFSYALKLRNRLFNQKKKLYRIIYSLPFLSIIEQNFRVLEEILRYNKIDLNTNIILKHHYLSDTYYKDDEGGFETDEAKILIEGWNSEIIVTTFIQFFHTLISNKNSTSRRFHRLSNSIIILDEIQAIPYKYWYVLRQMLSFLTEYLDSYVIFVTATKPLIFGREDIHSLLDEKKYFESLNRITIKPQLQESITLKEFVEIINIKKDKSYLFILNTIKSAKDLYKLLQNNGLENICFLSTHVIPKERLKRINEMKKGINKIAVTTQLVRSRS